MEKSGDEKKRFTRSWKNSECFVKRTVSSLLSSLREFRFQKHALSVVFLGNISSCLPEPQVIVQPVQPIAVREELLVLRPKVTCLNPEKIDYSVAELIIALRCANESKLTAEEKEEALQMILRERNKLYHRPLK